MKKRFLLQSVVLFLAIGAGLSSCSKSDDGEVTTPTVDPPVVVTNDYKFEHRVLLEDFTGAWCQFCPYVAHDIDELEKSIPTKFQAMAIHNGDSFDFFPAKRKAYEADYIKRLKLKSWGYPAAYVNRNVDFREGVPSQQVLENVQAYSPIGIKIFSSMTDAAANVSVSLKFGATYAKGVKVAIFVLEDGLVLRQSNATQFYLPIVKGYSENFVHNNVVVGLGQNDFFGELVDASKTVEKAEVVLEDVLVMYKINNVDNLKVVVVVSDQDNQVLNVGLAKGNSTKDYVVVK